MTLHTRVKMVHLLAAENPVVSFGVPEQRSVLRL